jgi:hypothetical protein
MSYLLIAIILLAFLFLWSRLPDSTQGESMKLHPDQLGEPDEHGCIKVSVPISSDPPTIPGYAAYRIDLSAVARPPRVVSYGPRLRSTLRER